MSLIPAASAAVQTEVVEYRDGKTVLEGYLAYPEDASGPRPGMLIVHEWKGLNDYAKRRARQVAELGYAAFAIDMYGKGVRANTHEQAAELSGMYRKDRALMRRRAMAGFNVLRKHPRVDATKLGAIGYCFGGTTVLELARSGAPLLGVVSFHGGVDTPASAEPGVVRSKVLVLHGEDDTFVSPEHVAAFEQEMLAANVNYHILTYPGAVHSFTVPEAGSDPSTGMAYHADADAQSWRAMADFFTEVFSSHAPEGVDVLSTHTTAGTRDAS